MQSVTIVITSDCLRPRTHKLRSEMIELVLLYCSKNSQLSRICLWGNGARMATES